MPCLSVIYIRHKHVAREEVEIWMSYKIFNNKKGKTESICYDQK